MKEEFILKNFSLRNRIFFSLILLCVISSVLISAVSAFQFRDEARRYHQYRLERKESAINENINYILSTTPYSKTTENIPSIFKDKIHELATIHNTEISIHDLNGELLSSSKGVFSIDSIASSIPELILATMTKTPAKRFVDINTNDDSRTRTAYNILKDNRFKPLGIIKILYNEDTEFYESEIRSFLHKISQIYVVMLILSIAISYLLSNYITQSLKKLSSKITSTKLGHKNEKIENTSTSIEIASLINAYNKMVDKLDDSYEQLAKNEREQAWREMAKQVAHEIKNPLTPMRLTIQNFERRFDPTASDIKQRIHEYSEVLIQQIDTMSAVANAFSSFATLPVQQDETIDIVSTIKLTLTIFNEPYIQFDNTEQELIVKIDRTQLIRIITNLVKNAIQAIPNNRKHPFVKVSLQKTDKYVIMQVSDNGIGITTEDQLRIFEPKFTTKSSGMGLGLGIIKNIVENYNGTITFESTVDKGTTFTVKLPIINI